METCHAGRRVMLLADIGRKMVPEVSAECFLHIAGRGSREGTLMDRFDVWSGYGQ